MDKEWREFEKLVARIEGALAPVGAVVKANDWIKNNLTGRKRQVDASIRYTVGTAPVLITVECRKRKAKQDDTWIEQLATKKRNLGAAMTIAVTSSDISEQAKKTASFYGIEIRRISEITQDEMLGWIKIKGIKQIIYHPLIMSIKPVIYSEGGESGGMLHPDVMKAVEANPGNAQVFVRHSDGKLFSVNKLLDAALIKGLDLFSKIPLDGAPVPRKVIIHFPKGMLGIQTEKGPRDLARLDLGVNVHATVQLVPFPEKGFSYADSQGPVVYGVEAHADLLGEPILVSIHKRVSSGAIHVTIAKEPKAKGKRQKAKAKN